MRIALLLLLLLSSAAPAAAPAADDGWKKADEADGITIYEKKEGDLLAFRAEGLVDAPVLAVAGTILDYEHNTEWIDHLEEETVLKRPAPGQYVEYTHVGTPFVIKDRDFLCLVTVTVNEKEKFVSIESHSVVDAVKPPTKYVRGEVVHNEFRLFAAPAGKTQLKGEFHIDPKGTVPKWIVNLFQRAWPMKAFKAIRERVAAVKPHLPEPLAPVLAPAAKF
jgi:hypothetical protein